MARIRQEWERQAGTKKAEHESDPQGQYTRAGNSIERQTDTVYTRAETGTQYQRLGETVTCRDWK
jgi:hypothetical protein